MNKLQLYITISQSKGDFQTKVTFNPDDYIKDWICDLRTVVSQVDYPKNKATIFYMLKYIEEGMFITVIRTINKKDGNNLANWIFIPYSIKISDKDIQNVVAFMTEKATQNEISKNDIGEMRELFDKEYEEDLRAPVFAPSEGIKYAYRFYGPNAGVSLDSLIGRFRFQESYLPYAGVLLVDEAITSDVSCISLTSAPTEDMAVVYPPQATQDLGFSPTIFGQPFDLPFYVPMGRNLDIIWQKDKYDDIKQTIYVAQSEMRAPSLQQTHPSFANIRIQQQQQRQQQTQVQPEPKPDNGSIFMVVPEQEPEQEPEPTPEPAPVEQSDWHKRFMPQQEEETTKVETQEPDSTTEIQVEIPVQPQEPVQPQQPRIRKQQNGQNDIPQRKKVYHFQVPTISAEMGSMITFEITTNSPITQSPIEGYEATGDINEGNGRINNLIFKGDTSNKNLITKIIYGVAGLIIGALVTLLFTCSGGDKAGATANDSIAAEQPVSDATYSSADQGESASATTAPTATTSQTEATPAATNPQVSLAEAINYLDNNKTWDKAEMDKFPDLKGLYDDMNNINRQRLVDVWGPKLKESRTFTSLIVHHSKLSMKKKERRNPYNKEGDTRINVQSYLNTIDP